METIGIIQMLAAIGLGFGSRGELPGSLAITTVLLLAIAIWSLAGARGAR